MAELGSHQLDASGIFCTAMRSDGQKALPLSVSATGCRSIFPLDRDCDDHVFCTYEYPRPGVCRRPEQEDRRHLLVDQRQRFRRLRRSRDGHEGNADAGTRAGSDALQGRGDDHDRERHQGEGRRACARHHGQRRPGGRGEKALDAGPPSRGYTEEMEHFAWCIRNFDFDQNKPKCYPKVAMADAIIALVSNIAIRENRRIEFKPEWFDIDNDDTPEGVKPSVAV